MNTFSDREKGILSGLFLSKFDKEGLQNLGFSSSKEAFNIIGVSLGISPNSIKNYRDEFDPKFPNSRQGWHMREMTNPSKLIFEKFKNLSLNNFSSVIRRIVYKNSSLDVLNETIENEQNENSSFAKRLITGLAAENYFQENYNKILEFKNYELEDTTKLGCGFDFRLHKENEFICVEVKGLNGPTGGVSLTDKEYRVADFLTDKYFLFVVKDFKRSPFHSYYKNPLSQLTFKKIEQQIVQTTWNANALL